MDTEIRFTIPKALVLWNIWQRMHWSKKSAYMADLKLLIFSIIGVSVVNAHAMYPFSRCSVRVRRFASGSKVPDPDGLNGCVKGLLDCLVVPKAANPHGLAIILDDNGDVLTLHPVEGERCKRGEDRTEVVIVGSARVARPAEQWQPIVKKTKATAGPKRRVRGGGRFAGWG